VLAKMEYRLGDIANNEQIVLFDTSAKPGVPSSDILAHLGSSIGYRDLDLSLIRVYRRAFQWLDTFVSRDNVKTIPEVTKELRWLIYKLEEHQHHYDRHKRAVIKTKKSHKYDLKKEFEEIESVPESAYKNLRELADTVYSQLCASLYKPRFSEPYSLCSRLACAVEEHGKCKRPYKYSDNGNSHYLGTDEKLIGTALYCSIVENKSPAIITGDVDFIHVFQNGIRHVFSEDLNFSDFLLEQFAFFPISVYVRDGPFFNKTEGFDLIKSHPPKRFGLIKGDHKKNMRVRKKIANYVNSLCRSIALMQ